MRPRQSWNEVQPKQREADRRWFASHHVGNHPPNVRLSTCAGCRAFLKQEVWPCKR